MVERAGLENRCTAPRYRGFESHLLRWPCRTIRTIRLIKADLLAPWALARSPFPPERPSRRPHGSRTFSGFQPQDLAPRLLGDVMTPGFVKSRTILSPPPTFAGLPPLTIP